MNSRSSGLRPFLARYEVEIPQPASAGRLRYDEAAMILMAGDVPAASVPPPNLPGATRLTRVGQETTDDD